MLNARKIILMADAASGDSPVDSRNLGPVKFRRGDDLAIEATFLQGGIVADMSAARKAVLEILDIGSMNSPDPRSVSLLMRRQIEEFGSPICDSEGRLNEGAENQSSHATFEFSNLETQISSGEKWLALRVEYEDGEKLTFASGWIFVDENFLSDPELLPIENPQYIKRDEAGLLFLNKSGNLSDLDSKPIARDNLDVYSKSETEALINSELEFLPAYTENLEAIKTEAISAKSSAIEASASASEALLEVNALEEELQSLKEAAEAAQLAAEQARDEAEAISDPDGLLQKHTAEIAALQAGKANIGEHFFSGGTIQGDLDLSNTPLSVCLSISNFSGDIATFGDTTLSLADGVFTLSNGASTTSSSPQSGTVFELALIFNGDSISLYSGASEILSASFGAGGSGYTFGGGIGSLKSVLAFNFDMSADDAPYTIADYAAGIPPTLLLKQGTLSTTDPTLGASTGEGWNLNNPSPTSGTVNGDWTAGINVSYLKNRTDDLPEGASYAVDILSKYFIGYNGSNFYLFNNAQNFSAYNGKTIWLKISGWARKNTSDATSGNVSRALGFGFQSSLALSLYNSEFEQGVWTKFDKTVQYTMPSNGNGRLGIAAGDNSNSFTDYAWSLADVKVEVLGEALELADFRSAYQIKDLSGNGNHATIFGEVLSRKIDEPATMQVEYTWGSDVSTGAYIMGDTVTLPANSGIEVLAKSSASATLSLGTSSSASTTFANAASVGTATASIAKFYTGDAAQKLFATPSVAGLTINLTLKITSLK